MRTRSIVRRFSTLTALGKQDPYDVPRTIESRSGCCRSSTASLTGLSELVNFWLYLRTFTAAAPIPKLLMTWDQSIKPRRVVVFVTLVGTTSVSPGYMRSESKLLANRWDRVSLLTMEPSARMTNMRPLSA